MAAAAADDFSFPAVADAFPRFAESPPLWRPSSADERANERRSFSCMEMNSKRTHTQDQGEEEEKMDMLWEDFNDELMLRRSCEACRARCDSSDRDAAELGCVGPLKMTKRSGAAVLPGRKPGVVVFMKALKKLFVLHHFHRPLKRHAF
ncbi:uncharacterized protein LOC131162600 [Malania oleifera]|uniref:uncharacterized protein LOC131162600 n=1 Tax=Malania oleifera TaxID=397392 RepID=UPI0025ADCD2A|nr:uncharacterized protein LOC131162600 [Malania oleifera]